MNRLTLYYNNTCKNCEKLARLTDKLDWFNQIKLSTEIPQSGELTPGEIAVFEHTSNRYYTGVYAIRKVSLNVPLLSPYGLLLFLPLIKKIVGKNKLGCNGDICDLT